MEYIDTVEKGRAILSGHDKDFWKLGALAANAEITVGRPKEGEDKPTLGDLANAWNVSKQSISAWRSTYIFYPTSARTFDEDIISWEHYNQARCAADGDLENALELLCHAERLHLGSRAFKRFLKGIYYEGEWQGNGTDIPGWLRLYVPRDVKLWITVQRMKED